MRASLWITRFDWDSESALRSLVAKSIEAGFTDLLMQVRGAGDALYRSDVAPTSPKIADQLGGEPAFDPLGVVIDAARRAEGDVRVHAWVNVLTGWLATSEQACLGLKRTMAGSPNHALVDHRELVLVDAEGRPMPCPNETDYLWLSPRSNIMKEHLRAVVSELCGRYPLAGVHLDRIRYPGGSWRDRGYTAPDAEPVTNLVRAVRESANSGIELTAALVPDYSIHDGNEAPSHLTEYGQDGWKWVTEGLVDSVMPMVYTPIADGADDDWTTLMENHVTGLKAESFWIPMFAGLQPDMLRRQRHAARGWPAAGIAWYSAGLLFRQDRWSLVREFLRPS